MLVYDLKTFDPEHPEVIIARLRNLFKVKSLKDSEDGF
jgi:hypothetical protein